jgi:hypothetical protein
MSERPDVGRCGYAQYEPDNEDTPITEQQALEGINKIRNSIVALQTINWSEHIYPLVSLLNRAGYEGMPHAEGKAKFGTLLDRCHAAEAALEAKQAKVREAMRVLKRVVEADDRYTPFNPEGRDEFSDALDAAAEFVAESGGES